MPQLKRPGIGGRWVSAIIRLEAAEKKKICCYVGNLTPDSLADQPVVRPLLSHLVFWGFQIVGHSLSRGRKFEGGLFEILYKESFYLTRDFSRRYSLGRRIC